MNTPWPAAGREAAKHSAPRQARGRKLFRPPAPGEQGASLIGPA